jgi:hypothetical protein
MDGGATFYVVTEGIHVALKRATDAWFAGSACLGEGGEILLENPGGTYKRPASRRALRLWCPSRSPLCVIERVASG